MSAALGRVLVTGGAGFIGSELARQLKRTAEEVVAVDNLVNGKRENLADVLGGSVRLEVRDIRDESAMASLMHGVDTVFHLACLGVRHSLHSPRENHDVNATATLGLLAAAKTAGVRRFVYVSSSEVYGTAKWAPMTEDHPTFPETVYGASKLAGECYARAYHRAFGLNTAVVRPFNAFGPRCHHEGDSGEVIPKFMLRCMAGQPMLVFGDGTQTRDFTFVSDTAAGIIAVGSAEHAAGVTVNLGSGKEITINSLAEKVREVAGRGRAEIRHVEPRPADVLRLCADTSIAQKTIGFTPSVTLDEGLDRLKAWYESLGKTPDELLKDEIALNWVGAAK